MGLKNSRPLPFTTAELEMAPFFKRRFRTWHLDHVSLVVERYRALTMRHCIDAIQLGVILGIKEQPLLQEIMRLFMPKTPTRVHHMVDAMEIVIALILVCQAPNMLQRFEAIFDVIDLNSLGVITPADTVVLFGAVGRAVMKLFRYTVEPNQRAAMTYIHSVLESGVAKTGSIERAALCKQMVTDQYAVHYVKQCTGEAKPKLYVLLEKDTEFLGAIEFHTLDQMKSASLKTIRELAATQLLKVPSDFTFLCQGRAVKRVWEADRKGWAIVPFAMRGSPGLRANAIARNRKTECPKKSNFFEFRYMGNTLARYKKKISEINPVYKHTGFKISSKNGGKPLTSVVKWRVAENWSGEWVYEQPKITAATKTLIQKKLRNAPRAKMQRVAVKNHRGELISPWGADDGVESRPTTANEEATSGVTAALWANSPAAIAQKKLDRDLKEKKIKWKARVIAMDALQQLDCSGGENPAAEDNNKENESRSANRTKSVMDGSHQKAKAKSMTVLIHVQESGRDQPSRLLTATPGPPQKPKKPLKDQAVATTTSQLRLHVNVIPQKFELRTPSLLSDGKISLGSFLTSSNIDLDEDEVEVFPVIVIRPCGEMIEVAPTSVNENDEDEESQIVLSTHDTCEPRVKLWADTSYLTDFEFDISPTESNFEHIYHHIHGTCLNLIHLNRRDVFGRTMLHDAAEQGHNQLIELLLKARVLRNVADHRGDTPLHHAARRGHLKEVSALIRERAAPWQLNFEGKSALFVALEAAAMQMGQSAVTHKRPPSRWNDTSNGVVVRDVEEKNLLATSGKLNYSRMRQVIDLLWDRYPVVVLSQPDSYDRTNCLALEQQVFGDLFQACREGNLVRVQRLIDLDKRATAQYINDQLDTVGRTGLHEATEQGHSAIVDLLLKFGADGYLADQRDQLPVHSAAEKGHERIVKCLVFKFPGTLTAQDCVGKTPLHPATERNHSVIALHLISAIKELQVHDHVLDTQDMFGYTALHYACIHGNVAVCRALVEAGAAANVSRYETRVEAGRTHLLGVFWKQAISSHATRAPVGFSLNEWRERAIAKGYFVGFDLDSPAELLLRSCKLRPQAYHDRLHILKMLISSSRATASRSSTRVKVAVPPLYHLAVEIAATNISVAVDMCKTLRDVHYEVNLVHHVTAESALLQECQRVCRHGNNSSGDGQDSSTDLALIRTLIQIGANVNLPNEMTGETPLTCAAWHGHLPMLDLLLEAHAERDYFPKNSFSPLHFAALGNHVSCAKLLISNQADVNVHAQSAKQQEAPLFFAIRSKSVAMVELLLSRGADPCAVCTLQQGVTTSFGVHLSLQPRNKRIEEGVVDIAPPLTFTLLIARSVRGYASQTETNGVARAQKRHEWESLSRIALLVAQHAIATTTSSGSVGSSLITRNDVYLACYLGFWDLAKLLLTQQVMLLSAPTSSTMNAVHLAAAAGQTAVVIALIAAGMNVNCRVIAEKEGGASRHLVPLAERSRAATVVKNRGALFFALVNGHIETAAKLLVLDAQPLDTIPHIVVKHQTVQKASGGENRIAIRSHLRLLVHESIPKTIKDDFFASRTHEHRPTESPTSHAYHHHRVATNFATHLECSLNFQIPLLHYVAGMGNTSMVQQLVEAGMSMLAQPQVVEDDGARCLCKSEWRADTAIHVAILCGHLAVVQFFAKEAQFNFPRFFLREAKKPESLLVTACKTHRLDILRYLVSGGHADEQGGGYNGYDTADDIEQAMNCSASEHFVEGFTLLLQERARPDLSTLVHVIESINWGEKKPVLRSTASAVRSSSATPSGSSTAVSALYRSRRDKKRPLGRAVALLTSIVPHAKKDVEHFFNVLSFDHILKVLIICAQYELWFVLEDILVANEDHFMAPLSPWKPILVRAVSCCMAMHRAAQADRVHVLRFFLRLGVPADLRLIELPFMPCPIWYAATRSALQSFLLLALNSKDLSNAMDTKRYGAPRVHYRSIECSTSYFSTTEASTCRWQNLSAMSCYDSLRTKNNVFLVQKYINLWMTEEKYPNGNSLLHLASATGDPMSVQMLLDAGADVFAENLSHMTPLMAAAARKDPFGAMVVRALVTAITAKQSSSTIDDETAHSSVFSRALVTAFAQPPPCNLKTAKLLLAAGADVNFEDETSSSAMRYAMRTSQFAGTKLLLDHGAKMSLSLVETFVSQFQVAADNLKTHWRAFASFLKTQGQRLFEVESLMLLLLEKKYTHTCWNENLLLAMLNAAAAIAATTATRSGQDKKFWGICSHLINQHAALVAMRKTVWGQQSALHYAVQSLEVGLVQQLVELCGFEVDGEDERKRTPLHFVAMNGDEAICRVLLSKLNDPLRIDATDLQGRTPLHIAVVHGHEAVVLQLVRAGASLEKRCQKGYNAHLYASTLNHVAILMALYDRDSSRGLLYSPSGEFAAFDTARQAGFRVVRWLETVFGSLEPNELNSTFYSLTCLHHKRTLLHYAAKFGDIELVKHILKSHVASTIVNACDATGYTPLLYAFAFGKLAVVELLLQAGADPNITVDHSNEANTHPYASRFGVSTMNQWVMLPGWFPFILSNFPAHDKRILTKSFLTESHFLLASGYHRRYERAPVVVTRYKRRGAPLVVVKRNTVVRTTLRSWKFPKRSLFEFACEIGDQNLLELLTRLPLPGLIASTSSYAVLRRAFLETVQWNRIDMVKQFLVDKVASAINSSCTHQMRGGDLQFSDFLEVGVDCAVSRGHQEMTILLLSHWHGIKENGRTGADANAFAFQFAHAFQVACIRHMMEVVSYMITRGGDQIVSFHWNDGPSLVYAFAFGHTDLATLLQEHGAHVSSMDTYIAPSFRKWIDYGCPQDVQVQWYELSAATGRRMSGDPSLPAFLGPLEQYDAETERLDSTMMAALFLPQEISSSTSTTGASEQRDTANETEEIATPRVIELVVD